MSGLDRDVAAPAAAAVVLDAVDAPTLLIDRAGTIVAANTAVAATLGFDPEHLVGRDVRVLTHTEDVERMIAAWRDVFEEGRPASLSQRVIGVLGGEFDVEWRARPVGADRPVQLAVTTLARVEPRNPTAYGRMWARELQGDVLDALPMPVLVVQDELVVFANPAARALFGVAELAEMAERERTRAHLHPDDLPMLDRRLAALERGETQPPVQFRIVRPDGSIRSVHWATIPIVFGGQPARLSAVTDITELVQVHDALAVSEARMRGLAEMAPVGIFETDVNGIGTFVNDRWCQLTGRTADEAIGVPWVSMVHPDDVEPVRARIQGSGPDARVLSEARFVRPDGSILPVQCEVQPLPSPDGEIGGWLVTATDVSLQHRQRAELRASERRFRRLAHRDPLTGLLNRRALIAELDARLAAGTPTAVLFCDLDDFKRINDSFGHGAGDSVLVAVAERLTANARRDDLVARLAGDEFVLVTDPCGVPSLVERLRRAVDDTVDLGVGRVARVGASIGVALAEPPTDVDALIRRADHAMYEEKRLHRGPAPTGPDVADDGPARRGQRK